MNFTRILEDNDIVKIQLIPLQDSQTVDLSPVEGNFSKSKPSVLAFDDLYFTVNTVDLSQEGEDTSGGFQYTTKFSLYFPANSNMALIMKRLRFLKIIRVIRCDGKYIDIGRNDYFQNKPMAAAQSSNKDFVQMSWSVATIFPYNYQE